MTQIEKCTNHEKVYIECTPQFIFYKIPVVSCSGSFLVIDKNRILLTFILWQIKKLQIHFIEISFQPQLPVAI